MSRLADLRKALNLAELAYEASLEEYNRAKAQHEIFEQSLAAAKSEFQANCEHKVRSRRRDGSVCNICGKVMFGEFAR